MTLASPQAAPSALLKPEAQTCRDYVLPKLKAACWETGDHSIVEQKTFTDGRIVVRGVNASRAPKKRADYLLHKTPDRPLAVVEAKASYATPAQGLQQAKDYAEILGLRFAYATNGHGIIEHDYTSGFDTELLHPPGHCRRRAPPGALQGLPT